jgi:DNA-binding NarL/FixJ family response regulator
MRSFVARLDPLPVLLALITAAAIWLMREGPEWALLGGASVLVFGVLAEIVARRFMRPEPTPAVAPSAGPAPAHWYEPLTKRQSEVALLLADEEGLSNKDIADRLFISERGVEAMVQVIFNRLSEHTKREFHSRTQVALWVKERMAAHPPAPPEPPARRPVPR